jgi:hypothetical protein
MLSVTKKRPGRKKDPESKRSQGRDRHTKPRVAFHLSQELLDALERYCSTTRPRPGKSATLVAALEEFLAAQGFWPPPAPPQE